VIQQAESERERAERERERERERARTSERASEFRIQDSGQVFVYLWRVSVRETHAFGDALYTYMHTCVHAYMHACGRAGSKRERWSVVMRQEEAQAYYDM